MAGKRFSIDVKETCSENWNAMSQEEQGRFCASCSKVVVDFASMSENQIKEFFRKHDGSRVCGRIRQSQTQRTYSNYVYKRPWYANRFLQYALSGFLTLKLTDIHGAQNEGHDYVHVSPFDCLQSPGDAQDNVVSETENSRILEGTVYSDDQFQVAGAVVTIQETGQTVETDSLGKFRVELPAGCKEKQISLAVSHPLHLPSMQTIEVSQLPLKDFTVVLVSSDHIKMGIIMYDENRN